MALVGVLMLVGGATASCGEDDAPASGGKGGGAGTATAGGGKGGETRVSGGAGTGGDAMGGAGAGGDAIGGAGAGGDAIGGAGAGGDAIGGAGGATTCDCGPDVNQATIPLDCACAAGLCSTFADDIQEYRSAVRFGWPYYVLLGTCGSGYRTLSFGEAMEQSGRRTYDATGNMVYDRFSGYDGFVPDACGFDQRFTLGSVTIGEDPAQSCSYCLLAGHDDGAGPDDGAGGAAGAGGAGGAGSGEPYYPESNTPRCDPSVYE